MLNFHPAPRTIKGRSRRIGRMLAIRDRLIDPSDLSQQRADLPLSQNPSRPHRRFSIPILISGANRN
jgi:hypothetical protein